MYCPLFQSDGGCGFHSEYYKLSEKTHRNFCMTNVQYKSCSEFIKAKKEGRPETVDPTSVEDDSRGAPKDLGERIRQGE